MEDYQKLLYCESKVRKAFRFKCLARFTLVFTGLLALSGALGFWSLDKRYYAALIVGIYLFCRFMARQRLKHFETNQFLKPVEDNYPELKQSSYTALDLLHEKDYEELNQFEKRVVDEVAEHQKQHGWINKFFTRPCLGYQFLYYSALGLLIYTVSIQKPSKIKTPSIPDIVYQSSQPELSNEVSIEPGSVEVERYQNLLITAQFERKLHQKIELVFQTEKNERIIDMQRNLDDHIYVAQLKRIEDKGLYSIRWIEDGQMMSSSLYTINVFDYPALESMELLVEAPAHYQKNTQSYINPKTIKAYAGSKVTVNLDLNLEKLQASMLMNGETRELKLDSKQAKRHSISFELNEKSRAEFFLSDAKDRKNQLPIQVDFELLKNKEPKIEVVLPKRDIELTAISELPLKAKIKDDVGLLDWGIEFYINGQEPIIISHQSASQNKSPTIDTYIPLELYDLQEKDVVSYHFYAIDVNLSKKERKIYSDLYFVQIRPFLRSYQEKKSDPGGEGGGDALEDPIAKQKQIIAALFNLKKMHHDEKEVEELTNARDTISSGQATVAEILKKSMEKITPDNQQLLARLNGIYEAMLQASEAQAALEIPAHDDQLQQLLTQAQGILSELFRLRSSMVNITKSQSSSKSKNNSKEAQMRKKKRLKLAANSKYKEEQDAKQEDSQLSEELQDLHALQELAQRQLDLNREMESLLAQLEKAKTEEEKEELERKLKKLQDEQEELQKEAQAMSEKMQNQNQSSESQAKSESQEKLQNSQKAMNQASQNLKNENYDEALSDAQKAQRELEKAEEEMREASSQKLGERMNQLSQQAKELEEKLQAEREATSELAQQKTQSLSNSQERRKRAESISERKEELDQLLSNIESVTRSSDETQKALSDELYRALRQAKVDNIEGDIDEASELAQHGIYQEAQKSLEESEEKVSQLADAIDKAASRILGDESKSLAQAQQLLENFADSIENELERLSGNAMAANMNSDKQQGAPQQLGQQQANSQEQGNGQESSQPQGQQPGQGQETQQQGQAEGQTSQQQASSQQQGQQPGKGQTSQQQASLQQQGQQPGKGQTSQQQASSHQQGQQPGEGQASQQQASSQQQGQQPGKGQTSQQQASSQQQGQQPGKGQASQQQASSQQQGKQPGKGQQGQAQASQSMSLVDHQTQNQTDQTQQSRQTGQGAGDSSGLFTKPGEVKDWLLDLRNVEQLIRDRDQRQSLAGIRDRLRGLYNEQKRHSKAPQAETVRQKIYNPLVQLLKKLEATQLELLREKDQIQIDRDPIPDEFKKMVQEYFLNLSESK